MRTGCYLYCGNRIECLFPMKRAEFELFVEELMRYRQRVLHQVFPHHYSPAEERRRLEPGDGVMIVLPSAFLFGPPPGPAMVKPDRRARQPAAEAQPSLFDEESILRLEFERVFRLREQVCRALNQRFGENWRYSAGRAVEVFLYESLDPKQEAAL